MAYIVRRVQTHRAFVFVETICNVDASTSKDVACVDLLRTASRQYRSNHRHSGNVYRTRLQIRRRTPTLSGAVGIGTLESCRGADMKFLMPRDETNLPDPLRSGGLVFPSFGIPWVLLRSADPFKAIPITRLHDIPPTDRDQRATTQVP